MTSTFLAPVVQESTPSIIARRLREAITHGDLAPGAQLNEADLASSLGVSRGPLREAMQRLAQEGLLVSIRNRGLFVIELTEQAVHDLYLARTAVERAAAAELLQGDRAEAARQLTVLVDRMARADQRHDSAAIGEADSAFHELLVHLCGSSRLARMHQTLLTETRMCVIALKDTYPDFDIRVAEHRAIVTAIKGGKPTVVDKLIIAHMADAVERLAPRFSHQSGIVTPEP